MGGLSGDSMTHSRGHQDCTKGKLCSTRPHARALGNGGPARCTPGVWDIPRQLAKAHRQLLTPGSLPKGHPGPRVQDLEGLCGGHTPGQKPQCWSGPNPRPPQRQAAEPLWVSRSPSRDKQGGHGLTVCATGCSHVEDGQEGPQKAKEAATFQAAMHLPGVYPQTPRTQVTQKPCTPTSTEALF